jgi:hypothetical protein
MVSQTHTYAELEVSAAAFDEIFVKLEAAGYQHAFIWPPSAEIQNPPPPTIDMHGIGLVKAPERPHIIPLRIVGGSDHDKDARAREVVTQLAVAHMVSGLRVLNRLRGEQGLPAASLAEVKAILGMETP